MPSDSDLAGSNINFTQLTTESGVTSDTCGGVFPLHGERKFVPINETTESSEVTIECRGVL